MGAKLQIESEELYKAYSQWCKEKNKEAVPRKRFDEALVQKGFKSKRSAKGTKIWLGIDLKKNQKIFFA